MIDNLHRKIGQLQVERDFLAGQPAISLKLTTAAFVRLVGALMLEQNDEWAVGRRYMSLESLAPVSDDPLVKLPGVAA